MAMLNDWSWVSGALLAVAAVMAHVGRATGRPAPVGKKSPCADASSASVAPGPLPTQARAVDEYGLCVRGLLREGRSPQEAHERALHHVSMLCVYLRQEAAFAARKAKQ